MAWSLHLVEGTYAVCRLDPGERTPDWAGAAPFSVVARTPDELSIVCRDEAVPEDARAARNWRALAVDGPLDFGLIGVLASLSSVLATAGISLMAISTFDTDYLLVRSGDLQGAVAALRAAGHRVEGGT